MGMDARMVMKMEHMSTDMITLPTADLMVLQSWFSPSFPVGAFSYSSGMETAIARGDIQNHTCLTAWLEILLIHGQLFSDAVFLNAAIRGRDINDLCLALCASAERHQETTELGAAFSRTVSKTQSVNLPSDLAYPVAIGMAAQQLRLEPVATVTAFLQGACINSISVAVRSVPLGQIDGQKCLLSLAPTIEIAAARAMSTDPEDVGSFTLAADICAIEHETAEQRIYRT